MLSDFKDEQLLAYELLNSDLVNNSITHAYLIEENDYDKSYDLVLTFVKKLLCDNNHETRDEVINCVYCKSIDTNNCLNFKVVSPDGLYIKKQQIIDLQQEFSRMAVDGKKKIYVIRECEKLRVEAANAMLKFLEEPVGDVTAILMTKNINNVLPTIISRCKVIKLNATIKIDTIEDSNYENIAMDIVAEIERGNSLSILSVRNKLIDYITGKDRNGLIEIIDKMISIYYDLLSKVGNCNSDLTSEYSFNVSDDLVVYINKINLLVDIKDKIKFNVNCSLLIDYLVIMLGGVSSDSRS